MKICKRLLIVGALAFLGASCGMFEGTSVLSLKTNKSKYAGSELVNVEYTAMSGADPTDCIVLTEKGTANNMVVGSPVTVPNTDMSGKVSMKAPYVSSYSKAKSYVVRYFSGCDTSQDPSKESDPFAVGGQ